MSPLTVGKSDSKAMVERRLAIMMPAITTPPGDKWAGGATDSGRLQGTTGNRLPVHGQEGQAVITK